MKQLLILSGKGGTGKTTVASAFIKLSEAKAYADCDVDAPNLHLITEWTTQPEKKDYYGLDVAKIRNDLCIQCGQCETHCRFDAISCDAISCDDVDNDVDNGAYVVNPYACEGCGVCEYVCPVGAIKMVPKIAGEMMLYKDDENVFSTAQLEMGSGTSGLLVTEVKKRMVANTDDAPLAIIDGSPGIGCPVIASLSGVDMVLVVAEPSLSGMNDMERIIQMAERSRTKIAVCVNKYDTGIENTEKIEAFCKEQALPFVGRIPFDKDAVKAINHGKTIVDIDCASGRAIKKVYDKTINILFEHGGQ
jgi:MinD superfamily P-loop ATPase